MEGEASGESQFYGFERGTYFVTENGRFWLVQSDDRDDLPVEVDSLPDGGEWLDSRICQDIDVSEVIR